MTKKFEGSSHSLHWKSLAVSILLLATFVGSMSIPRVYAAEVYTFYTLPIRSQEYNTPGATLYVNITNAVTGSLYKVTFAVTDPTLGGARNASNQTVAASTSILLSVVYPRDFPAGTLMRYVGNYTVGVSQQQPSNKPSVATGSWQVGLTDLKTYHRTNHVSIEATGYASVENITTSLSQAANPAPGFPLWQLADSSGNLNYSWRIPPSEQLGTYTLTLTGSRTTKTVADTQQFAITTTGVILPGMTVKSPSISRSLTQQFTLAPHYEDNQRVQTGQALVRIAEADGVNVATTTASYDNLTGVFRCSYYVPKTGMTGIWIATVDPNLFNDGYGNTGPALTVTTGFDVLPASLNVTIISAAIGSRSYAPGDIIPIYASVSYPDGSTFGAGSVQAKLTRDGVPVGTPVALSYVPGQQAWAGTYQVGTSDPSGLWLITVDASNQMGDSGEGTYSATVDVPPAASTWFTTSNFLLITAIIAAAMLAVLVWALFAGRRRVTRKQMKLDLTVVDKEVAKIEDSQFFQNIKKQVDEGSKANDPPPKPDERAGK